MSTINRNDLTGITRIGGHNTRGSNVVKITIIDKGGITNELGDFVCD